MDTDLALALLSSTFEHVAQDVLLEALIAADGDIDAARLTLSAGPPKKRRRGPGLTSWIKQPAAAATTSKAFVKPVPKPKAAAETRPGTRSVNDVLKPPIDAPASPTSLLPITLTTPAQCAQHLPCTMILNVLDGPLASDLFLNMMKEAKEWQKNVWWMVDRMVESPHTTCFYADSSVTDSDAASHWYNGRKTSPPRAFTPLMLEARTVIESEVAKALSSRTREPMEYAGPWRANVSAANHYWGRDSSVGAHADQITYLGPQPTIASLTLGVTRTFRLRGGHPARTYNVVLPHNTLLLMHAGCQERYKHSVPPATALDVYRPSTDPERRAFPDRINLTLRFYRPDFGAPPLCQCNVPCLLRSDVKYNSKAGPEAPARYYWQCQAGAQNEGKSCGHYVQLDMAREGRGPCIGDVTG